MKKTIAVIFGGYSPEYDVSLKSASSVIKAISREKYELFLIGITREGNWLHYNGDVSKIADNTWIDDKECYPVAFSQDRMEQGVILFKDNGFEKIKIDAVFPILHGKNGEDGTVQGLCELAGIDIVGCDTLSSALCMDKVRAHKMVELSGITVPDNYVIGEDTKEEEIYRNANRLKYPIFVKPVKAGSSFGISKVQCESELIPAIKEAFKHDDEVIIEEYIEGFEVGCAILGNDKFIIGEIDEVRVDDGFFDYEEKYTLKNSQIHMPARIDKSKAEEIKNIAVEIYKALGCKNFARVDMFLTLDEKIIFNEVNTIPGFTPHSRYPNMMSGIGMTFEKMISSILELVI